jgi:hypothetical protein
MRPIKKIIRAAAPACFGRAAIADTRPRLPPTGWRSPGGGQHPLNLAGLVERVTFHNEDSGFCVLSVKARGQRDLITVVGHAATIDSGQLVQASGRLRIIKGIGTIYEAGQGLPRTGVRRQRANACAAVGPKRAVSIAADNSGSATEDRQKVESQPVLECHFQPRRPAIRDMSVHPPRRPARNVLNVAADPRSQGCVTTTRVRKTWAGGAPVSQGRR